MSCVELVRALQVLLLKEAAMFLKSAWAHTVPNAIVHRITEHGGHKQQEKQPTHLEGPTGSKSSGGKE